MSGFVAPYSPPAESSSSHHHHPHPSKPAGQDGGRVEAGSSKTNAMDLDECPRTLPRTRMGKNGLRETRTESSLPTPPRTRDVRLGSRSPVHHRSTSPPNSKRRPTFASQLAAPMEEGGLIPPATIEEEQDAHNMAASSSSSNPFNPFLVSTASSSHNASSSSSTHPYDHSSTSHHASSSSNNNVEGEGSQFSPLPPPAPPARSHRIRNTNHQPQHPRKHLDALGPSRRGARKGSTMAIATERNHAQKQAAGGPIWEEGNPFLEGMGLVGKGLVGGARKERVGEIQEKETMGYVFRGVKTLFANPYYNDPSLSPPPHTTINDQRSSKPIDHPDYSPPSNPHPRLLFPVASAESDEDDDAPQGASLAPKPRLLFAGASTPKRKNKGRGPEATPVQRMVMEDEEEEEDELESDEDGAGEVVLQSGSGVDGSASGKGKSRREKRVWEEEDRESEDEREGKRIRVRQH